MEREYRKRERSEPRKYLTPFTGFGSVLGAGAASLITFPLSTAYGLYRNIPYMLDGEFMEGLSSTLTYGLEATGTAAVIGGVAGLVFTARVRDWIGYLFRRKKR